MKNLKDLDLSEEINPKAVLENEKQRKDSIETDRKELDRSKER